MEFHVVTIFPDMIENYLKAGILGRANRDGLIRVKAHNLRDFALNRYGQIDDGIFGAGKGMLFRPEPLKGMLSRIKEESPESRVIYLTPQGKPFSNKIARRLSREKSLILLAARYEGIDCRIVETEVDEEISVGDYVLTGGELPALTVMDAVSRFVEGSIKSESADEDSFENGLLEHGHYTQPVNFEGLEVPEILRSGNHEAVEKYRFFESLKKTYFNRPDLLLAFDAPVDAGETKNPLKILQRQNEKRRELLIQIEKIAKEWKDGRRNSEC